MNVFSNLSSLVFIGKNLSFALGSSAQSRDLEFLSVHVGVCDFVTEEVLLGSGMLEDNGLISSDDFSSSILRVAISGVNFPDCAVYFLVDHAHFLVSRESSVRNGRDLY